LVAVAKFLVAASKHLFVDPNFVAVTKPFFSVWWVEISERNAGRKVETSESSVISSFRRRKKKERGREREKRSGRHPLNVSASIAPHGKKWFCYGNKIRNNKCFFFIAATRNLAAATKRLVDRTKHLVVVTKYLCCPYFNK